MIIGYKKQHDIRRSDLIVLINPLGQILQSVLLVQIELSNDKFHLSPLLLQKFRWCRAGCRQASNISLFKVVVHFFIHFEGICMADEAAAYTGGKSLASISYNSIQRFIRN